MTDTKNHGPESGSEYQDNVPQITLEFDEGDEVVCEPLFIFDFEEQDYIALVPIDEENDEVYLYVYNEFDNGEFEFLDIEDDAQFDRVVAEFERIIEEAEAQDA